jgi:hypothetical protein
MSATVDKSPRKAWSSLSKDPESAAAVVVDSSVRADAAGDAMVVLGESEACSPWNTVETRPKSVDDGQTACPGSFANPSAAVAARMNQSAPEFSASQFQQPQHPEETSQFVRLPSLRLSREGQLPAAHRSLEKGNQTIIVEVNRFGGAWQGEADTGVTGTTPTNSLLSGTSRETPRFSSGTSQTTREASLLLQLGRKGETYPLPQHLTSSLLRAAETQRGPPDFITSASPPFTGNTPTFPSQRPVPRSAEDPLSRTSMGYSTNQVNEQAWSVSADGSMDMIEHEPADYDQSCSLNEGKDRDDDETATVQSFDSTTISSPAIAPLQPPIALEEEDEDATAIRPGGDGETPSSVSTVAESDDASLSDLHSLERSFNRMEAALSLEASGNRLPTQQQHHHHHHHHRTPSWEQSPQMTSYDHTMQAFGGGQQGLPPPFVSAQQPSSSPWDYQRVTSFRGSDGGDAANRGFVSYPPSPAERGWPQGHHPQPQNMYANQVPFLAGRGTPPIDNRVYHRQNQGTLMPYPMQPMFPQVPQSRRSAGHPPSMIPQQSMATPPRPRAPRPPTQQSPHRGGFAGPGGAGAVSSAMASPANANARSSSEVLKTLLRKKACLYEPDTSRAVALVTWLVGRELALEFGYFSRQQLQAGVHACVSEKIDAGVITRTKVNRCMQIILNSCFHYIIPRPDGTEECGDVFRALFATEAEDDSYLLQYLPEPWTAVEVDREEVLIASQAADLDAKLGKKGSDFATPQSSPRFTSTSPPAEKLSPVGGMREDSLDLDDAQKRSVLLCFNESVRRAEDVFRCHNEFIRDTAHASHLQLSSQEWRTFFGHEAAAAPYLWGNVGIPVPYTEVYGPSHADALGMMSTEEAGKFRTSWCTKRYDHDHELCGFAHSDVNNGWLRRNPAVSQYKDEMCPFVTTINDKHTGQCLFVLNECARGANCEHAHSTEEILYHPRRYKMRTCHLAGRSGGCNLCDVCPHFHPLETYRFPKKSDGRASRHSRYSHQTSGCKGTSATPAGAPLILASPAPVSSFEEHFLLPGLRSLYRRQCAVVRSHVRNRGSTCHYSYFGDDDGVSDNP